jgi:hypothetical protein
MGDIAQLTLSNTNEVPEEILQFTDNSPIGVINTDQADWLLLVHLENNRSRIEGIPN